MNNILVKYIVVVALATTLGFNLFGNIGSIWGILFGSFFILVMQIDTFIKILYSKNHIKDDNEKL